MDAKRRRLRRYHVVMGVVGDISSILTQLYTMWRERRGETIITPPELYTKYVRPSYELLKGIHCDYEDMYLELTERVLNEDTLTDATVRWFSRARTRRAVDRSEMAVFELPPVTTSETRMHDISTESLAYIRAVRAYFEPTTMHFDTPNTADIGVFFPRMWRLGVTRSTATEVKLRFLQILSRLLPEDHRAVLAEAELETSRDSKPALSEDIILAVLAAVTGEFPEVRQRQLSSLTAEAQAALLELPNDRDARRRIFQNSHNELRPFKWRQIINDHVAYERDSMASGMKEIQLHHIHLRILADR